MKNNIILSFLRALHNQFSLGESMGSWIALGNSEKIKYLRVTMDNDLDLSECLGMVVVVMVVVFGCDKNKRKGCLLKSRTGRLTKYPVWNVGKLKKFCSDSIDPCARDYEWWIVCLVYLQSWRLRSEDPHILCIAPSFFCQSHLANLSMPTRVCHSRGNFSEAWSDLTGKTEMIIIKLI